MMFYAGACLTYSGITRPPCLEQLHRLASTRCLDNIHLLHNATAFDNRSQDALPSHLILNAWWTTDMPRSIGAVELLQTWRSQGEELSDLGKHATPSLASTFDGLLENSTLEALSLSRKALESAKTEMEQLLVIIQEEDKAIARIEALSFMHCKHRH
jgi:hypothetical protein